MITTIDSAGRVVIPKTLRQQYHLNSRTEVEIIADGDSLRLRVPNSGSALVEKDGFLIHSTGETCDLDVSEFINQQREGRALEQGGLGTGS